ncbi:MAG: hypothetical protein ACFFCZ_04990 [Promethearchaeota archaeon]
MFNFFRDWSDFKKGIVKWIIIIILFLFSLSLEYKWRRAIHIITGFAWWGMVFFLVFILIPSLSKMKKDSQYDIIGFVIPRIFRTASSVGFFTTGMGWYNAIFEIANMDISYFFIRVENTLLLIGMLMVTGLYIFHLFLESKEIKLAFKIANQDIDDFTKSEVENFLSKIRIIPTVGFLILTTAVLLMFIH